MGFEEVVNYLMQNGLSVVEAISIAMASGYLSKSLSNAKKRLETHTPRRIWRTYNNVEEFWTYETDTHTVGDGAKIKITGLLLPYGPLIPAHPMQRPGYFLEGWDLFEDISTRDREEYDARDGIIYGDRVVRVTTKNKGLYYAGLFGHRFGISNVTLPLTMDEKMIKKHQLEYMWHPSNSTGKVVTITGVVRSIPSYYRTLYEESMKTNEEISIPTRFLTLKNYHLEVRSIKLLDDQKGVTHIATSICWQSKGSKGLERTLTDYFNCRDDRQWDYSEKYLFSSRRENIKNLVLDFDDLNSEQIRSLPPYNEVLRKWVD